MVRAAARLAPVAGLVPRRVEVGDVVVFWTAAATAPLSTHAGADGGALLLGDALRPGATQRTTARELWDAWTPGSESASEPAAVYDGFYVGIAARGRQLTVGGDILGLFPINFAARGDVLLVGSSSLLFPLHPLFDNAMDESALFGHLLTGGPFDGRALRRGVTRLAAGSLLRWHGQSPAREVAHYRLPGGNHGASPLAGDPPVASFDAAVEEFDAALQGTVRRHTGVHAGVSLLLSGGRDSRLLAGYFARERQASRAITLGAPTDYEASCAAGVARELGVPHRLQELPFEEFEAYADATVRWEDLASGMSTMHTWGSSAALRAAGGGVLSGYLFEMRQIAPLPTTTEGMLEWSGRHALTPAGLRSLTAGQHATNVEEAVAAVTARFLAMGDDGGERSWRWLASVYARFHSGGVPWRLSFSSWPILPILDQALMDTMLRIPAPFLANRRLQDALLRRRFPRLARLPLDRNAHDTRPLSPSLGYRALAAVRRRIWPAPTDGPERRFYARMYDFDNAGWRAVRRAAEPGREAAAEWFRPEALATIVPSPDRRVAHGNPITDGFGPKMLVGFMRRCALDCDPAGAAS